MNPGYDAPADALTADELRAVYRRRAPRYDLTSRLCGLFGYRLDAYRRRGVEALRLRPGDTVVELGCGTGANFAPLEDALGPAVGVTGETLESGEHGGALPRDDLHRNR